MPERLAYDEAMQFSRIRLKVQDPELKQGQVEIVTIRTAAGPVPARRSRPVPIRAHELHRLSLGVENPVQRRAPR